jgi:RND family efflux transporter MFP subunit
VAQAGVHTAQADLEQARARLEWARIKTPISGIVTQRNINRGEYVRSAENAPRPAFTVVNADLVRVSVNVPDRDVPYLDVGDPATVHLDALPGKAFKGQISRISGAEDPETRTMRCEIDLPNSNGKIRPGMYGGVVITLDQHDNVWTIPASAIISIDQAVARCYRLVDGRAVATEIHSVPYDDGVTFGLLDGLDPDDLVIANPDSRIKDGEPLPEDEAEPDRPSR